MGKEVALSGRRSESLWHKWSCLFEGGPLHLPPEDTLQLPLHLCIWVTVAGLLPEGMSSFLVPMTMGWVCPEGALFPTYTVMVKGWDRDSQALQVWRGTQKAHNHRQGFGSQTGSPAVPKQPFSKHPTWLETAATSSQELSTGPVSTVPGSHACFWASPEPS
jgi:hypothetical protein